MFTGPLIIFVLGCVLFPAFLIFRSKLASGWRKTRWVTLSITSFFAPSWIAGLFYSIWQHSHHRTKMQMLGDFGWMISIAGIISVFMPWVVYSLFKKNAQNFSHSKKRVMQDN